MAAKSGITEDLKDKKCILTGGAGVIGTIFARTLVGAGVHTAILDIDGDAARAQAKSISGIGEARVMGVEANVLDRDSLEKALEQVHKEIGPIDFLINAAGGNSPKATSDKEFMDQDEQDLARTFFGLDMEGFDFVFDLNFKGTILPTMVLAKDLAEKKSGVIINISSMNAFRPLTRIPAYSAAKAAVNNFTEWLSVHLAPRGIRVNGIAPGFFLTRQNRFLLMDEESNELTPRGNKIIMNTPMGRFGAVEELGGTLLYLLSDMSVFVTGVVIPVDGGFNAYSGV